MKETCGNCKHEFPREKLTLTLPWEDGNNSYAYWECPYCGYHNIKCGYGEDD